MVTSTNKIILVVGPDATGKTEISKALAKELDIPYFKVSTEKENWHNDTFRNSLAFDMLLPQFILATDVSCVFDRGYPCEWVYSKVFGRKTDKKMLERTDNEFASINTSIIILRRHSYENSRPDELVPQSRLLDLDEGYEEFTRWTAVNDVITMFVDDYEDDLKLQISQLLKELG